MRAGAHHLSEIVARPCRGLVRARTQPAARATVHVRRAGHNDDNRLPRRTHDRCQPDAHAAARTGRSSGLAVSSSRRAPGTRR